MGIRRATGRAARRPSRPGAWLPVATLVAGLVATLAGCGTLPHPFEGNPGGIAMRLAVPPPARLVVQPAVAGAALPAPAARLLAQDVAHALLDQEVPAEAQVPKRGDWRLQTAAHVAGGIATPSFAVYAPDGVRRGAIDGLPVPAPDWQRGDAATLGRVAGDAGPRLASLLTAIQAGQMQSDPNSLMNRPARIYFTGVTGAPGDGNMSLAQQLAAALPDGGNVIQTTPRGADFTLHGAVRLTRLNPTTDHVEVIWTVTAADGREAGRVAQLNDIPAHTLDGYWGEVASVVAREAAGGIREVVTNNSGRNHKPLPVPGGPGAAKAADGKAGPGKVGGSVAAPRPPSR